MKFNKNIITIFLIVVGIGFLFNSFNKSSNNVDNTIPYSSFLSKVSSKEIVSVTIKGQDINGTFTNGQEFYTYAPFDPRLVEKLASQGVTIVAEKPEAKSPSFLSIFLSWLPMIILIGLWIFFMKSAGGGIGGKAMGMGKSKARMITKDNNKVTFKDVAGIEEAKEDLVEVVDFLKNPSRYYKLGGKIPKGVLLVGPPGTGKTLLAKAVAGEAGVSFFSISGSDFVEMFVGIGAARVRDLFADARKSSPCIIFIDELDAVGRHRGAGIGGGNDEREQTLNQMLVEMDGFEEKENIIIMAATNRPDVLDPALLRPGRFDRQVVVPNPDLNGREKILQVHSKKVTLGPDVDLKIVARGTPGFSGADLANLVNESALMAARRGHKFVNMDDFEFAKDKIMMGAERRTLGMTDEEKKLTAYHEAGHALAAVHCPNSDPIHKATIIPRGRALGMVMRLPERDEISMSYAKIKDNLIVGIGGRIAEELIFGKEKITTGASSDIQQITSIATKMVTDWGYSEKLGTVKLSSDQQEVFLGHNSPSEKNYSESTAEKIDSEVRVIINEATSSCMKIIKDNIDQLHIIAKSLLKYETLTGKEIDSLLKGEDIKKNDDIDVKPVSNHLPSSGSAIA